MSHEAPSATTHQDGPSAYHVDQSTPASCVAACVCMVRRWRGEIVSEQDVLSEWGSGGPFAVTVQASFLHDGSYPVYLKPRERTSREILRAALRTGNWAIISIFPLTPPVRRHAVVLVGLGADDSITYLDPGYARDGQPRTMSEDDLVRVWTGEIVMVSPMTK